MTEQEKARGRRFVVGAIMAMFVIVGAAFVWQKLNEPMEPQVIEFSNSYHVRWGNRFQPFVYQKIGYDEEVRLPTSTFGITTTEDRELFRQIGGKDMLPGWHSIDELPSEAYRRLFEGRIILDAYLHP